MVFQDLMDVLGKTITFSCDIRTIEILDEKSKPKRKYIRKSDFKSDKNSLVFEGRMLKV